MDQYLYFGKFPNGMAYVRLEETLVEIDWLIEIMSMTSFNETRILREILQTAKEKVLNPLPMDC